MRTCEEAARGARVDPIGAERAVIAERRYLAVLRDRVGPGRQRDRRVGCGANVRTETAHQRQHEIGRSYEADLVQERSDATTQCFAVSRSLAMFVECEHLSNHLDQCRLTGAVVDFTDRKMSGPAAKSILGCEIHHDPMLPFRIEWRNTCG